MMNRSKNLRTAMLGLFMLLGLLLLTGSVISAQEQEGLAELLVPAGEGEEVPELGDLAFLGKTDFSLAECVDIYYYEGGYKLIRVYDSADYLMIPEGEKAPEGLTGAEILLPSPAKRIYLAATSAMALFQTVDGLEHIRLSSISAENWYVEEAKAAMEAGEILFAGKYSEPDYELLLAEACDLAIESTMILHSPKVQEMIERLGTPVFIDRSSYEPHPLGRSEWVKVYGAMIGKEAEADAFFREQASVLEEMEDTPDTGKTVAFFSVNTNGSVVVRRTSDYVPKMIEIAGGHYALSGIEALEDDTKTSTVNMTMEEFYHTAVDADVLVYNATIEAPVRSVEELVDKNALFADFKGVKDGNVWCTDRYLYQATDIVGQLIRDFHIILTEGDEADVTFLKKLD